MIKSLLKYVYRVRLKIGLWLICMSMSQYNQWLIDILTREEK